MGRDGAFWSHGHHDVRTNFTYSAGQVCHHGKQILLVEFAVRVVEHRALLYFE